jgi:hypothetical protein
MIKDHKITLNGKEITNIREVTVKIETPGDIRGIYREPTFAPIITITRNASDHPTVDLFDLATNIDGRKNLLTSGTLEFTDDNMASPKLYSFKIKSAFISNWTLNNPEDPHEPTTETVELRVGELEYNADGKNASFALEYFK